jgi:hypothetical protein
LDCAAFGDDAPEGPFGVAGVAVCDFEGESDAQRVVSLPVIQGCITILVMRVDAESIADNGLALEARGNWAAAASYYERASHAYIVEREFGAAEEMQRRALTCRAASAAVRVSVSA